MRDCLFDIALCDSIDIFIILGAENTHHMGENRTTVGIRADFLGYLKQINL